MVDIIKPYISSKSDPAYKIYKTLHTGVDVKCDDVLNICPGVATLVNVSGNHGTVIIQYDLANCIQYSNLRVVDVQLGQYVDTYARIGSADKYVHIDYLATGQNVWPVRVGAQTLYKHDPTDIVLNGYESIFNYLANYQVPEPVYVTDDELPPTVDSMLYYNRDKRQSYE